MAFLWLGYWKDPNPPRSGPIKHELLSPTLLQFLEAMLRVAIVKFIDSKNKPKVKKPKKQEGGTKKNKANKKQGVEGPGGEEMPEVDIAAELEKEVLAMGPCQDAAEAVRRLIDRFIFPNVPAEAMVSETFLCFGTSWYTSNLSRFFQPYLLHSQQTLQDRATDYK